MCNCDCELDKQDRWDVERFVAAQQIADWIDKTFTGSTELPARIAAQGVRNGEWDED